MVVGWIFSKSGFVLSSVPSQSMLPGNRAIHLSMLGMSAQVPWESVEKHSGLNSFTVTNVSVLFQVESERTAEGAISVKWECWWVENDLRARQEKNSDDDSIRSWFRECGWEKLNSLRRIFFQIWHNPAVLSLSVQFCTRMWASLRQHFHHMQDVSAEVKKSHGCSLVASESFNILPGHFEIRIPRTMSLCNTVACHYLGTCVDNLSIK